MNRQTFCAVLPFTKTLFTPGLSIARRLLTAAFFVLVSLSVSATVYNVTNTSDGNGVDQLRGALTAANVTAGPHTINVAAGTYILTMGQISFGSVTSQNITIVGAGPATTIINQTTAARIFLINPPGTIAGVVTSISGIRFRNADANNDNFGGGAILCGGRTNSFTAINCVFENNRVNPARTNAGGAVRSNGGGTFIIDQCTFTGNSAPNAASTGGALQYQLTAYSIGGVPQTPNGSVSITNSTFTNNTASNGGGAILVQAGGGSAGQTLSVTITENNFINNSGNNKGGAIFTINSFGTGSANAWNINYNRFVGNTATLGSGVSSDDVQGNINATNNWWGCNGGPASCADKAQRATGSSPGVLTATPYLQLRSAAATASLCSGAGTTITSRFTTNSDGTAIDAGNLGAFTNVAVPVSFNATLGTLSNQQTTIQSGGTATATYTAGSTAGTGTVNAVVDNVPANDATARASITINSAPTVTSPANAVTCAGTTATFTVTGGGSGTLSYQWFKGAVQLNNGATGTGSTISGATTNTLTITNPGASDVAINYNVRVSSTTGCGPTTSANASLTVNTLPATPMADVTQPSCSVATGTITVSNPTGAGITYSINGSTYQSSNVFNNVAPGNYNVTARNNSGCTSTPTPVTINAAPASPAAPSVTVTQPSCSVATGTITVQSPAGTGITYSINSTDYQSNPTFSNVAPGNYNVTAKNSSGCVSAATPVTINAQPPTPAAPMVSVSPPICPVTTGTITVNSPSGTGITYSINGTDYQTSNVFNNVAPGSYNVTAKNSSGCVSAATPVTINASPAAPAMPMVSVTQPSCTAATGSITVNSPTGPTITYSINGTNYQASNVFSNLMPGNYNVTARNGTGCPSAFTPVTINPPPATPAAPTVNVMQPTCSTPSATITVTAPAGSGITYSINGSTYQAGTTFSNVAPGNYNVTAKNGSGCVSAVTPVVINTAPASLTAPTVSVTQPSCNVVTGSITISSPTGSGITYSINGTTYQSGTTFNNVAPGNYNVTARSGSCTSDATPVTVDAQPTDNQPPVITSRNITINLDATGRATIQPSDVIQSATDNCSLDSTSFKVTPNNFSCSGTANSASHQAYVANTTTGNQNWAGELGMEFRVNRAAGIVVKQLGTFDHQGNGITGTQSGGIRVAIFNKATQSIVAGLDVTIIGNADSYTGNHRMKNITPVTLMPGDYVIVSKGYNAAELNGNAAFAGVTPTPGDISGGAISYTGTSLYSNSNFQSQFSYPTIVDGGPPNRYLAGTFVYDVPATADTGSANHQAYVANTTTGNQSWAGELGMEFKVNKASGIIVKQLGTFDHQGNGITGAQSGGIRVAIFNKATRSIVPGLETVITGNADSYTGNHRMKNVTPVTLMPGDYVIVSKGYNDNELNGNASIAGVTPVPGDVSNGAISYTGTSLYGNPHSATFFYPQTVDGGPANRYLAGTFVYDVPGTMTGGVGDNTVLISVKDTKGNIGYATATVTVTDVNGVCSQPSASMAAKPPVVASAVAMRTEEMRVYPNPSTGVFAVAISNIQDTEATLQVISNNGKLIEQKRVPSSGKILSQTVTFNLANQPAGLYFVKLVSKQGIQTAKVVIQR